MQCPAFVAEPIGVMVYEYSITFSGQVGPGLDAKPKEEDPQTVVITRDTLSKLMA